MPEISSEMIEYPSNGHTTPAYLSQPTAPGPHPAVVVLQEWWGLVPHIKEVTDRFAAEGFIVLAPDLYHGQSASEPNEAQKLAMALDRNRAVAEICAAVDYLQTSQAAGGVGVIGWCMGGALALSTAADCPALSAVVVYYGRPLSPEDTPRLKAPVLGLYGELDGGIPPTLVREFEGNLAQAGVPHEIHIYPNAQHAFFNDTRPNAYDPVAATDAWRRTLGWFREHIKA